MLVSMNWIKDYVDLSDIDLEKLIHRFTLSTAEVEDIFYKGTDIQKVIVAKIVDIVKHPDSKKLNLLKIDTGTEIKDCVCGAPNVKLNMNVAFAQVGGQVGDLFIKEATIAGYKSEGMCTSEAELSISADNSGIIEIDKNIPLGTNIKDIFDIDDIIFEVDNKSLTNRPDLWGIYGIAREFAVLANRPLKAMSLAKLSPFDSLDKIDVNVLNKDLVYRYSAIKIDNVTKKISPMKMRIRLFYCGSRGINLLTDLTNYIMLEIGQPMHAFDGDIVNSIEVKTFDKPFTFKTLDDVSRNITDKMLMICTNNNPAGIAGVMGGLDSEITENTTSVLLESANFNGINIRSTSTKLNLRTDASMRYEKILDPELVEIGTKRFVKLLRDIDPKCKVVSSYTDVYLNKYKNITLTFDKNYIDKYTGIDIKVETIIKTLNALDFKVHYDNSIFTVTVPSFRATKDVTINADIVEEITRIYGYDNFEITTTKSDLIPVTYTTSKKDEYALKDILVKNYKLYEVNSYNWCDTKKSNNLGLEIQDNVKLIDPNISENNILRNLITPSLICFIEQNKSFNNEFGMFEVGKAIEGLDENNKVIERKKLAILLYSKEKSEKQLFYNLKDMLINLSQSVKHKQFVFNDCKPSYNWQNPVNTFSINFDNIELGFLGTINPIINQKIDKKASIVFAEIDLTTLKDIKPINIILDEPSKYPSIDIDLSLILDEKTTYKKALDVILSNKIESLKTVSTINIYEKNITLRLTFVSTSRTLNMNEVSELVNKIIDSLNKNNIKHNN